jgi:hypothetical protein
MQYLAYGSDPTVPLQHVAYFPAEVSFGRNIPFCRKGLEAFQPLVTVNKDLVSYHLGTKDRIELVVKFATFLTGFDAKACTFLLTLGTLVLGIWPGWLAGVHGDLRPYLTWSHRTHLGL